MAREVLAVLRPRPAMRFLDATVGEGGHAYLLLEASAPDGRLVGVDLDEQALARARLLLADFGDRFIAVHENFARARRVLEELGWQQGADGVLLDLGLSSLQLESAERGFSFRLSGPLDMRFDRGQGGGLRAADLLARASERELVRLLREFGEEELAVPIARALVSERARAPLSTTADLARVIEKAVRGRRVRGAVHPATRTFQALRIAVNAELDNLRSFLAQGYELLRPGGRMAALSYHSLEDRMVKEAFRVWAAPCLCPPGLAVCACGWSPKVRLLTRRPLLPAADEVSANPRARSARLRAVERLV